jgi:hypothetical protein
VRAPWWLIECIVDGTLISWAIAACTSSWLILRQDIDGNELTQVVETAEVALDPSWESRKTDGPPDFTGRPVVVAQ